VTDRCETKGIFSKSGIKIERIYYSQEPLKAWTKGTQRKQSAGPDPDLTQTTEEFASRITTHEISCLLDKKLVIMDRLLCFFWSLPSYRGRRFSPHVELLDTVQWRNEEEDPTSGSKRLESPEVSSIIKEIFDSKGFPKMFSLVWRRNTSLLLWSTTWHGKARWRLLHLKIWLCYLSFFCWHIVVAVVVDFGSWDFNPLIELFTDPLSIHISNSCILKIRNNFWISQKRSDV